jgi:manganese/iron transport system permease protein
VSHAVLPGVVLAYLAGVPLIVGAFAAGMTCALLTGYLSAHSRVKQDTVLGIVFSGMFGIGLVLFVAVPTDQHLDHILFGNVLGVGRADLWTAGLISGGVALILGLKWRDLLLYAFDPAQAQVSGLRVQWLHYGLLTLLSLTIVAVLSAVGIILAVALLIAPGAIAFLLVRRFGTMLLVAVAVTLLATLVGTWASFHLNSAPAPTIVLVLTAMFLLALLRRMRLTHVASGAIS